MWSGQQGGQNAGASNKEEDVPGPNYEEDNTPGLGGEEDEASGPGNKKDGIWGWVRGAQHVEPGSVTYWQPGGSRCPFMPAKWPRHSGAHNELILEHDQECAQRKK